jgi:hypothetical protein
MNRYGTPARRGYVAGERPHPLHIQTRAGSAAGRRQHPARVVVTRPPNGGTRMPWARSALPCAAVKRWRPAATFSEDADPTAYADRQIGPGRRQRHVATVSAAWPMTRPSSAPLLRLRHGPQLAFGVAWPEASSLLPLVGDRRRMPLRSSAAWVRWDSSSLRMSAPLIPDPELDVRSRSAKFQRLVDVLGQLGLDVVG